MKKLIFLIPFMLVLSSCGDDNNINSNQTSSQATAGIGGGDITPNPDGDNSGSTGGSTTDPVNPGSDESGTSTDPADTGSNESGDESGSEIVDVVVNPGGNESGDESGSEIVDIVVVPGGGDESGSEIVDIVVVPGGNY